MRRPSLFISICLVLGLLVTAGCKDAIKTNPDAQLAGKVIATAKEMFADYDRKDFEALKRSIAPEFTTLRVDQEFDQARHETAVRWVRITADQVRLILGWEASWRVKGQATSSGGQCTLLFDIKSLKLVGLDGDHPFVVPRPKTVPDSPAM